MLTNESVGDQRKALHLAIHQRGEGQVVEQVCEVFPDVGVPVLAQTLVIEPINLRNMIYFCNVAIHFLIQTCVI